MSQSYKLVVKNAINSGEVSVSGNGFLLKCKDCSSSRFLKTRESVRRALVLNRPCLSCANTKKVKGIKFSEFRKSVHSLSQKRRYLNPMESLKTSKSVFEAMNRPEVKRNHTEALFRSGYLVPRMDLGQPEMLEKWNRLGFKFIPNYKVKCDNHLFYLDGYDSNNNVVFEFDSPYHKKFGQKNKDLIRQDLIIKTLNPKSFWRYDSVEKRFDCVYRNNNRVLNT